MSIRKELEKKIEKKKAEIANLEQQIAAAKYFIDGLQEALKLAPPDEGAQPYVLRAGSEMEKVLNLLRAAKKPMHIDQIVVGLNQDMTGAKRAALAGSLSSYAKSNRVFTKTAPNTFGLIEFAASEPLTVLESTQ